MKVVVINGAPRSGKDTFVGMCIENNNKIGSTVSMADAAKSIAYHYCEWNEQKTQKDRKFLSDLKDLIDTYADTSFKYVKNYIDGLKKSHEGLLNSSLILPYGYNKWLVFIMARQPEDIQRLKEKFNAYAIFISNSKAESEPTSNHADADIKKFDYDEYIDNNGTLEELNEKARDFVERILKNGIDY